MKQFNNTHRKVILTVGVISILVGIVIAILSLSGISRVQLFLGIMPIIAGSGCLIIASQIKT